MEFIKLFVLLISLKLTVIMFILIDIRKNTK